MIVVMEHGAAKAKIDHVCERIEALGLSVHLSQGEFRAIIGAIGDKKPEHQSILEAIDGVERVVPIMKPYKLASREFHEADSTEPGRPSSSPATASRTTTGSSRSPSIGNP